MASATLQPSSSQQKPAPPARNTAIGVALVVAAVLLLVSLVLLYTYPAAENFRSTSLAANGAASKDRPVEIQASFARNLFDGDEDALPLTVSVLNRGTSALTDLMVCVEAPGFELAAKDNCVTEARVEGLQRITKQVPLKPLSHSGMYMVTVKFAWRQGVAEQAVLRVGPVKIDPAFGALRWNRFGRRLASVFKDLTLPVILVLVGAWFNKMQSDREDARRIAETDRETERQRIEKEREKERLRIDKEREENRLEVEKKREEERLTQEKQLADRQQVRLLLLNKVTSLAEEHYLPIVSQTKSILIEAGRIQLAEPSQSVDKLFFHVVMLLRLMDHLRSSKGGVFLQKRTPERIVGNAWGIARAAFYGAMGDARVAKAITHVDADWTIASFTDSQDKQDALKELRGVFETWLKGTGEGSAVFGSFSEYLGVLDVIQAVFLFEADRPLSDQWYEEPSSLRFKLPAPTVLAANGNLPQSQRNQAADLKRDLEAFYQRAVMLKL